MKPTFGNLAIMLAAVLNASLAIATGDRLKIPVQVGQAQNVKESITFDQGLGASNAAVFVASGSSVMVFTNDGSHFVSMPTITDTLTTITSTNTLTGKSMDGGSNTFTNLPAATALTGQVTVPNGGTGDSSFTNHAVVVGASAAALQVVTNNATATNEFLTQSSGGAPAWAALLAADIPSLNASKINAGQLAVAQGGTALASGTSGGVLYFSGTGTIASSLALTQNTITLGGGAGSAPFSQALGSSNQLYGMNSAASAYEHKTIAVGTSGTDFAVANGTGTMTFNLPDASASNRGAVTTGSQTFAGTKTFNTVALSGALEFPNNTSGASAGTFGYVIANTISRSSPQSISNGGGGTNFTGGPYSITAGDWGLTYHVCFTGTATGLTHIAAEVDTADTLSGGIYYSSLSEVGGTLSNGDLCVDLPQLQLQVSSTTTYFLVVSCQFTGGNCNAWGTINFREFR